MVEIPGEEWCWWEALRVEAVSCRLGAEYDGLLADVRESVKVGLALREDAADASC